MNPNNQENEKVILDTHPHILFLIISILAVVALWFLYAFLICPFIISPLVDGRCIWVSVLSFFFPIIILYLDWINNRLILTNLKVIRRRGIIGKAIMDIGLNQIQDVKVSLGIIGRIFGFGMIEIESAGTSGKITFIGIPCPKRVKRLIEFEIQNIDRRKNQ